MQTKDEVIKEFERFFGMGNSIPKTMLEVMLDMRDKLEEINDSVGALKRSIERIGV